MKTITLTDRQATQLLSILRYAYNTYERSGTSSPVRRTINQIFTKIQDQL